MKTTKKGKTLLVITCFLHIVNAGILVLDTYCIAKVMECVEKGFGDKLLFMLFLAFVTAVLVRLSSICASATKLMFLTEEELTLKKDIVKNIFWRSLISFRKNNDAYYVNLLTTDAGTYTSQKLAFYPYLCFSAASIIFSVIMLGNMSIFLTAVVLVLSVVPFLGNKFFAKLIQKYRKQYSEASQAHMQVLKETIENCETIRLDNTREYFLTRFQKFSAKRRQTEAAVVFMNDMSMEVLFASACLLRLCALGIGAYLALQGKMSVAMLYAVLDYAISISNHFSNMTEYVVAIRSTKPIEDKLLAECTCPEEQGILIQKKNETAVPLIEYENVTFGFGDRVLYQNFSKQFQAGKCYAIVGESGSGKTTLTKLLLKYYEEYTGTIRFCGLDIKDCSAQEIYEKIGVINQNPGLFNAPLYENITMFSENPERNSEEYTKLLKKLNLTELAKRVGENPLGDFGDNISGGERQRISLARAFRKRAEIMIFDEPTTGLDPENVQFINELIFSSTDITRIVITHDWSKEYLDRFDEVIRF